MNKYHLMFKDWDIGTYHAYSPEKKYQLVINRGFQGFEDYTYSMDKREAFLVLLPIWERYLIWRELKAEVQRRLNNYLSK